MRNLVPSAIQVVTLRAGDVVKTAVGLPLSLTSTAFDVDRDLTFVATEVEGEITIWRTFGKIGLSTNERSFIFCGSFATPDPRVVSLRVLAETSHLVLVTLAGDIVVWELEESGHFVGDADVQGSVESGIVAAAWSPDDAILTLVTKQNVILMTSMFDVISEVPLQTTDFGEDAPINVGWGSKETQFHGSIGRAHLKPSTADSQPANDEEDNPDDDGFPRVSWRGDGAYFVVSSRSSQSPFRRVLRVYSHEGRLQATSETVSGLEEGAAWRPNGGLIASTQKQLRTGQQAARKSGKHDVVFFERNGLRHGEFSLRRPADGDASQYKVQNLVWSPDSAVLAVWIQRPDGDTVQLWTTGNYHWYLKQELRAPGASHFTSVTWHPEATLQLVLTTPSQLIARTFIWETCAGANDTGCVGVVDGDYVLLTPFRTQNVPPPMSSYQLPVSPSNVIPDDSTTSSVPRLSSLCRRTPTHVFLSSSSDLMAAIWEQGGIALWALHTRLGPGREKVMDPVLIWFVDLSEDRFWRQVVVSVLDEGRSRAVRVVALGCTEAGLDFASIHERRFAIGNEPAKESEESWSVAMPGKNGRLVSASEFLPPFWQSSDGEIFEVNHTQSVISLLCAFLEHCLWSTCLTVQGSRLFVGLSSSGKLSCIIPGSAPIQLSANTNSFTIASGFVIFTTNAHEAHFVPLVTIIDHLRMKLEQEEGAMNPVDEGTPALDLPTDKWERRRVERGSRIVAVIPDTMSLVLQMPRGNLETINPRPLVMEVVKNDLDAGRWQKAFLACRKHRIDLGVIVQRNFDAFMADVPAFVDQVQDVDYINLFLTNVGQSQLPPNAITGVCDAVRHELEKKDLSKYVNSILTAYVVKSPPDHEAGLALLLHLRDSQPDLVEDAVRYIIFLVDADKLFDTALGMYDFSLVLMIAQHAQKDPREYLPFLRELRSLPQFYQRFKIDDHLRRYAKALSNLHLAGPDYFQEALHYIEHHNLYEAGLGIWEGTESYQAVLNAYGSWLFDRRDYKQAALVFVEASNLRNAMVAHERALEWQELFELSAREKVSAHAVKEISYRVADELLSKKRYSEAGQVFIDYAGDIRQAVSAFVQGNEFSEARRIVALHSTPELLQDVILPGALEIRAQLAEDLNEMREQLVKQVTRLKELRIKKVEEPNAFYGTEDPNLHNVDVMTDVSMAPTAFTRYTVAASVTSKASKRSSKTKRKMERKIGSGRKGTVDEEEYLLKSVSKLVTRYTATQGEVKKLLPHLLHLSKEHRAEGNALQRECGAFEKQLRDAVEEIWKKPAKTGEASTVETWATRMQEKEKEQLIDPLERVPKPEVEAVEWGLKLLKERG
ncbi:pol II transcription elongation factor [Phlebopus sp. FC_14]|nr:pol II transcription elongation factor [Phlebopus sp. FC_14]